MPINETCSVMNQEFREAIPVAGQLDDTTTTVATEDKVAPVRITAQRAVHVNLRKNDGTEIGTATNPVVTSSGSGSSADQVQGTAADGVAPVGNPVYIAGQDGTNVQAIKTDANGELQVDVLTLPAIPAGNNNIGDVDIASGPTGASSLQVQGAAADGAAVVGNPVLIAGQDGTNAQAIKTDANGELQVDVLTLPALPTGSNKIGGVDLDSDATIGSAVPAVGQAVAGTDGTNARLLKTDANGELQVDVLTLPALAAGTNNIGDVDIASGPTGASALQMQGTVADGGAAAQNPVQIGGKDGSGNIQTILTETDGGVVTVSETGTADFGFTAQNSPGTVALTAVTGLGKYRSAFFFSELTGNTGGTLDVYLQISPDGGTTWVDYIHWPQKPAGEAATRLAVTIAKDNSLNDFMTVGKNTTPALLSGSVVGGDWGDRMRIVYVNGAGTSAGNAQTIKAVFSS